MLKVKYDGQQKFRSHHMRLFRNAVSAGMCNFTVISQQDMFLINVSVFYSPGQDGSASDLPP